MQGDFWPYLRRALGFIFAGTSQTGTQPCLPTEQHTEHSVPNCISGPSEGNAMFKRHRLLCLKSPPFSKEDLECKLKQITLKITSGEKAAAQQWKYPVNEVFLHITSTQSTMFRQASLPNNLCLDSGMRDDKLTNTLPEVPLNKCSSSPAAVLLSSQKSIQVRATLSVNKRLEDKCEISSLTFPYMY